MGKGGGDGAPVRTQFTPENPVDPTKGPNPKPSASLLLDSEPIILLNRSGRWPDSQIHLVSYGSLNDRHIISTGVSWDTFVFCVDDTIQNSQ